MARSRKDVVARRRPVKRSFTASKLQVNERPSLLVDRRRIVPVLVSGRGLLRALSSCSHRPA